LIQPIFTALPEGWQGAATRVFSGLLTLSLITYLHCVSGEQAPKIAALQTAEAVALWVARPVNVFARATSPLIRLMNGSSNWVLRRFGYRTGEDEGEVH